MTKSVQQPIVSTEVLEWADVLLVTTSEIETQAVLDAVTEVDGRRLHRHFRKKTYYDLGEIQGTRTVLVRAELGPRGGTQQTIATAIEDLQPSAVILLGIASGIDKTNQFIGDILIAKQIHFYEQGTILGSKTISRGDKVPPSTKLLDRVQDGTLEWKERSPKTGLILSGEKAIESPQFLKKLLKREPEAIGIEIGGAGLYVAAEEAKTDWILIRAIGAWADGSAVDGIAEHLASRNAAQFTMHVLQQGGFAPENEHNLREHIQAYLHNLDTSLNDNAGPLLKRFGRDLNDLRLPLRVVPYEPQLDIDHLRAREHFRRTADSIDLGNNDIPRRAYRYRGTGVNVNRNELEPEPEALDPLAPTLDLLILLGDPGSGKTEWLKLYARRTAHASLHQLGQLNVPWSEITIPIFLRLSDIAVELAPQNEGKLRDLLVKNRCIASRQSTLDDAGLATAAIIRAAIKRQGLREPHLVRWLWQQFTTPYPGYAYAKVVLCLDAWDEVHDNRDVLGTGLQALVQRLSVRVFVSSRIIDYQRMLLVDARSTSHRELQICPFTSTETEQFVRSFFQDNLTGQRLVQELRNKVNVAGMAQNPLLSTLLCLTFAKNEVALPDRRVDVYRDVLVGLLSGWKAVETPGRQRTPVDLKQVILEDLAFRIFPHETIRPRDLASFLSQRGYDDVLRNELFSDGILIPTGREDDNYLFLHLTFQEYLCARFLAERINRPGDGWQTVIAINETAEGVPIQQFVSCNAWHPEWHEVIMLLAGLVNDPAPLLQMLATEESTPVNPYGDDLFRHRLALAAFCLPEIAAHKRAELARVPSIGKIIVQCWFRHNERGRDEGGIFDAIPHLTHSFVPLAHIGDPALNNLIIQLHHGNGRRNFEKAVVVAKQLKSDAPDHALQAIMPYFDNEDTNIRRVAAQTLGELARATATEAIVHRLVECLSDPDLRIRCSIAETLAMLGSVAATETTVGALVQCLMTSKWTRYSSDDEWQVRRAVAKTLAKLGSVAATEATVQALVKCLEFDDFDKYSPMERAASIGHGAFVLKSVQDNFLDLFSEHRYWAYDLAKHEGVQALVQSLADENPDIRSAAVQELGKVGSEALTEATVQALVRCLIDEDLSVRHDAACTLAKLGPAAATEATVHALIQCLAHPKPQVRFNAAEIVGIMGPAAATEATVHALIQCIQTDIRPRWLFDEHREVRRAAASALGQLGPMAATEATVHALVQRLMTGIPYRSGLYGPSKFDGIPLCVTESLTTLGAVASTDASLQALVQYLADPDEDVRFLAARTLEALGSVVATEATIRALVQYLMAPTLDTWIGSKEASTRDKLDEIEQIMRRRQYEDRGVRTAAAEALGKLGSVAATEATVQVLVQCLTDQNSEVRTAAAEALGKLGSVAATEATVQVLVQCLTDQNSEVRAAAAEALGKLGSVAATEATVQALVQCMDSDNQRYYSNFGFNPHGLVVSAVAKALVKLGDIAATETTVSALVDNLDEDYVSQLVVAEALGKMGNVAVTEAAIRALINHLDDNDVLKTWVVADTLAKLWNSIANALWCTDIIDWISENVDNRPWLVYRLTRGRRVFRRAVVNVVAIQELNTVCSVTTETKSVTGWRRFFRFWTN